MTEQERMKERFREFFTRMLAESDVKPEPEGNLQNPLSVFFSMDKGEWTGNYDCQAALCVMVTKGEVSIDGNEVGTAQLLMAGKPRLRDMIELKKFLHSTAIPELDKAIAQAGGLPASILELLNNAAEDLSL